MESKKDYIDNIDNAERRYMSMPIDIRQSEDKNTIYGIASKVGVRYDMGWYYEEVMPGAFDEILNDDVRALFNHDPNYPLARSVNGKGTLNLSIDEGGNLAYEYQTPKRSYAVDLQDAIMTGDVSQSSFSFRIAKQTWIEEGGEKDIRQIEKFEKIYDVSPVTYPASQDTTVAKRSFEKQKPEHKIDYKKKLRIRELQSKI